MKTIGNSLYIQRGEDLTLSCEVMNKRGEPFMISRAWQNPYLVFTVASARYAQTNDVRDTYWLDLSRCYEQQLDGSAIEKPLKKFTDTIAYPLSVFSVNDAISIYGVNNGGKMEVNPDSENDVHNFLFYTVDSDGTKTFRYLQDGDGDVWIRYAFRFAKTFRTVNWPAQKYLYDAKILAGETPEECIERHLTADGLPPKPWDSETLKTLIDRMPQGEEKSQAMSMIESGAPLMPNYDVKAIILEPQNLFVETNIQGGN